MKLQLCYFFFLFLLLLSPNFVLSQAERKNTRDGNKLYNENKYDEAEASYKKALDKNKEMKEAIFNLGNAIYKQGGRMEEAISFYQQIASKEKDSMLQAKALHNIGNIFLKQEKYKEASEAFKNSLKKNPNDQDTRYNLAYANLKLKQQQNQKNNQNKENKDNKNQDKKEQDKKQEEENKKGDNKKDEGDKEREKNGESNEQKDGERKQQAKGGLKKEDAEKLLQALQNEEQKTNKKMMQKQAKPVNGKVLKDW